MNNHERHLCETCLQKEYEAFQHDCVHESMAYNEAWIEKYKIGTWERWDYSMEDATLVFSEEGQAKVFCKIEVAGSTTPESWEWAWGNENFPFACRRSMGELYKLREEKQWNRLTTLFLESDEYIGWECAAVARHVLGGIGVYRCPTGSDSKEHAVYVVILSAEFVN